MSAEFNNYAPGYDAAMSNPLKRISGASQDDFLRPKVAKLLEMLAESTENVKFLDFGCGTGDFLRLLRGERADWQLEGTDISEAMLEEAQKKSSVMRSVRLFPTSELGLAPTYDVIAATCVFHHIPPAMWVENFSRMRQLLKPHGRFFLFEHNPWNPLTQVVVRMAEIDRNAVLLSAPTARRCMREAGFTGMRTEYLMFAPPRLGFARGVDDLLRKVPMGAQYVVEAV
jgi:SAM-dependent methyltransferase